MNNPLKVLFLEDSEDDALLIILNLKKEGFDLLSERVCTAEEMITALERETWQLIIADYAMPSFSAPEALEILTRKNLDIPFIIVSGTIGEEAAVKAIKAGAHNCISKDKLARLIPSIEQGLGETETRARRRHAEQALRESERKLSTLLSNLPGMAYRSRNDEGWTLEFVSEGCYDLLGYRPSELIDNRAVSFLECVDQEDRERRWRQVQKALEEKKPFQLEYRILSASGESKWVWEQSVGIFSDDEGLIALEGFIHDISERKKTEVSLQTTLTELAASREDMERFAYIASHDLRAPLRAIQNLTQWIEEDLGEHINQETSRNMILLKKRVMRMEKMIDDILEYSRAGKESMEPELVNVNEMVHDIIELLNPPQGFTFNVSKEMPVFRTARIPLRQSLFNLIDNAIKHHHKRQGKVEITFEEEEAFYTFAVVDDGPGIEESQHELVFGMFKTLQSRDITEGSGVGLALVRRILDRSGGRIRLLSSPGQGSTFEIRWPKAWQAERADARMWR
ncbi:MAG: ATP-binding protein [Planctomycetota bacterium]